MQKVYLLLRSNKQTGPYTLEELLQFNLKPFDLVWVEGRSAAWQYPFEIPALKPHVPETPLTKAFEPIATAAMEEKGVAPASSRPKTETPKRVFVSVPTAYASTPSASFEKQAEPQPDSFYRQPSPPQHPGQKLVEEKPAQTHYARSLNEVEEQYTSWVVQQKTKKKTSVNAKDLAIAVLVLGIIASGYYVMSKPSVTNSVLPVNKTADAGQASTTPDQNTGTSQSETAIVNEPAGKGTAPGKMTTTGNRQTGKTNKAKNPLIVSRDQTNASVPPSQKTIPVEKTTSNVPPGDNTVADKAPVKQEPKVEETKKDKKKLGEVIKGIFAKKEKKEEPKTNEVVLEDPRPADNRQAQHRGESGNAPAPSSNTQNETATASLASQIDLSSNAPDSWMMGVKNLKITLRNRSNATIQTASVTVNYYDENNQLLDKKVIYFSNVAPKARATVAAPDHKWADHVDYTLTTVSAKEDRYAIN